MLGYIAHGIANPLARFWLATSSQSWRSLPRPTGSRVVHAAGADSDRVLLMGSGVSVGYGVVSHELGLGGHLARELSVVTGRGATVETLGDPDLSPATAWQRLDEIDLTRFDALVLTLGGLEVFTLMPAPMWRNHLDELLARLHESAPEPLSILIVETGVPLLKGLPLGVRQLVAHHATVLNAETCALAQAWSHTRFVAFDPQRGDVSTLTGRSTYREWAQLIAPAVATALHEDGRVQQPLAADEKARQGAVDTLDLDTLDRAELDRIVANARDLFGATGAAVTIVDHDVQYTPAAIGMPRQEIPRSMSICDRTIQRDGVFIVEDATTDPRLTETPWRDGSRLRFYAGYPVESPDGQRIGALCVVDETPRLFSDTDAALLRQLAVRVQSALWGDRVSR